MKTRGSSVRASSGQRSSFFVALMIPFNARLRARGYTEEGWDSAVAWLKSTDWFRLRGRYLGNI